MCREAFVRAVSRNASVLRYALTLRVVVCGGKFGSLKNIRASTTTFRTRAMTTPSHFKLLSAQYFAAHVVRRRSGGADALHAQQFNCTTAVVDRFSDEEYLFISHGGLWCQSIRRRRSVLGDILFEYGSHALQRSANLPRGVSCVRLGDRRCALALRHDSP